MARSRKAPPETPAEIPDETPTEAPAAETERPDELAEMLARLNDQAEPLTVWLYRFTPEGERVCVTRIPLAQFDEFAIGKTYGSGKYQAQVRTAARKTFKAQATFYADAPPAPAGQAAPSPAQQTTDSVLLQLLTITQQQAQASTAAMVQAMAAMSANRPAAPAVTIADMLALVNARPQTAGVGEMVTALKSLHDLAAETGSAAPVGASSPDPWPQIIGAIVPALLAGNNAQQQAAAAPPRKVVTIRQGPAPAKPAAAPTPDAPAANPPASPAPEAPATNQAAAFDMLTTAARLLLRGAKADEPDHAAYAVVIADYFDEDTGRALLAMPAGQLTDALINNAPEDIRADLAGVRWFVRLAERELRELFDLPDEYNPSPDDFEDAHTPAAAAITAPAIKENAHP